MTPDRSPKPTDLKHAAQQVAGWSRAHPTATVALLVVAVSLLFLAFPGVDLRVSGLFHFGEAGFAAQDVPFLRKVRHLGPFLVRVIAVAAVAVLLLKLLVPGRRPLLPLRQPLFALSTLILGPGILVNSILKNNWGRPRPRSVEEFGGDLPFQPVWKITDHCDSNCSFVSGEASAAMWLVGMVLLLPAGWRRPALAFVAPLGLVLSVNRVAFGGHFLSDTLISWGLTLLLILGVHHLLFGRTPPLVSDAGLDEWFTRYGRRLHRGLHRGKLGLRRAASGIVRLFSAS